MCFCVRGAADPVLQDLFGVNVSLHPPLLTRLLIDLLFHGAVPVLQDVSGGLPVKVESPFGGDLPLYGMQIDLEQARTELRTAVAGGGTAGTCCNIGGVWHWHVHVLLVNKMHAVQLTSRRSVWASVLPRLQSWVHPPI
jgi:hypothetical protein